MGWTFVVILAGLALIGLCTFWALDDPDSTHGIIGRFILWLIGLGITGLLVFAIVDRSRRNIFAKKASVHELNVNMDEDGIRDRLKYLLDRSNSRVRIMSTYINHSTGRTNDEFLNCTGYLDTVTGERLEISYRNVYVPGDENSDPKWVTHIDTITLRNSHGVSPDDYKIDAEYINKNESAYRAIVTDTMVQLISSKPFK